MGEADQPYQPPQAAGPGAPESQPGEPPKPAQVVFDVVVGPNLRLRDNLIQLATIIVGTGLGAGIGGLVGRGSQDVAMAVIVGGFIGLVGSLLLSGLVIGLVRIILTIKRR